MKGRSKNPDIKKGSRNIKKGSRNIKKGSRNIKKGSRNKPKRSKKTNINKRRGSRNKSNSNSNLLKVLLGTGAAIGAAALIYKLKKKFKHEKAEYEEDLLIKGKENFKDASLKNFDVRASNWTAKDKIKVQATNTMYKTQDVKLLKSKSMIIDIINKHPKLLPKNTQKVSIPDTIIINVQLPPRNGEFYSIVIYFKLKPETINKPELKNAVNLLTKYTNEHNNESFLGEKGRLKGIGAITKAKGIFPFGFGYLEYAIPSANYTGVLLKNTVTIFKNSSIFEIDIDISKFKFPIPMPSWLIPSLYDKLKQAEFELGFVIQGIMADELPEVLLGAVNIKGIDFSNTEEV